MATNSTIPFDYIVFIAIDYTLATIMWTLGARALLDIFVSQNNEMVIIKVLRQITNPFIKIFEKITPKFLVHYMVPMYVAWWFYMIRFYLLRYIYFGELGVLSFSVETVQDLFK